MHRHLASHFPAILLAAFVATPASAQVGTVRFAAGLHSPTYLTAPRNDFDHVFVTEQFGDIEILDASTGAIAATPFLSVANAGALASMAFHPSYGSNRLFFIYYRDTSNVVRLVRYETMAANPEVADPSTATPVLDLAISGHFGGWIGFGPDGYLYVQVGDGGDYMSHDAAGNGQGVTSELLASVLRIDVNGDDFPADPNRNYAIPSTNPFVGSSGLDEIWAFGLRNPWRGSFDRMTGDYYIADVGQDNREEIDFEASGSPGGRNYGWRLREGSISTPTGGVGGPQPPGGFDPVYDYDHGIGPLQGGSVTGGYVYRGPVVALRGRYFFGDYVNPRIWSIRVDAGAGSIGEFFDWTATFTPNLGSFDSIVSFGEDALANLYIVDHDGEVFLVTGPSTPGTNTMLGTGCHGPMMSGLTRPVIGTNWELALSNLPANSVLAVATVGFGNPALPLDFLGAPGCVLYNDLRAVFTMPVPIANPALRVNLPLDPSLVGTDLFAQGAAFASGFNALGIIVSNGIQGTTGDA